MLWVFITFAPGYQDVVGDESPLFYCNGMIEKGTIESHIQDILQGTEVFLVDVKVDKSNRIRVHVDKNEGISIDDCAGISRALEGKMDRDREDFSLEVSSPGIESPFRVHQQYVKNTGKAVKVETTNGQALTGILREVDDNGIRLELGDGIKPGKPELLDLAFDEIASAKAHIRF
jgi:ribosome maturation factor RimP